MSGTYPSGKFRRLTRSGGWRAASLPADGLRRITWVVPASGDAPVITGRCADIEAEGEVYGVISVRPFAVAVVVPHLASLPLGAATSVNAVTLLRLVRNVSNAVAVSGAADDLKLEALLIWHHAERLLAIVRASEELTP